jgi:NAD(P)H-nitrite reductase large subunit
MTRYVIVGGGAAGISAAQAIRAKDPDGAIVVVDADHDPPYYRTELDTYIAGSTPEADMPLHPPDFYHAQRIDLRLQTRVTAVRPGEHAVQLSTGEVLPYDALLLALGALPITPAWFEAGVPALTTVRTWQDARRVVQRATAAMGPAVVIGGGVLGLILAEGLRERGRPVELLEREARLWAPMFDDEASAMVAAKLGERGIAVHLQEEVTAVAASGETVELTTNRGRRLRSDLVVVSIGVRPELALLAGTGLRTDRGILIDHECRTNVPDIFAAGDAAQAYDPLTGQFRVVTNWNYAMDQGKLAGTCMAGGSAPAKGAVTSNAESFCGLRVSGLGLTQPPAGSTVVIGRDATKEIYRKLAVKQDRLIGALLVGNTSGEGMMRKTMLDGTAVTAGDAKSRFLTGLMLEERTVA